MKMISERFICPATGWGIFLVYDEEECELYARVCDDGEWDPDQADPDSLEDFEETERWCRHFGYRHCDSYIEAQRVADQFDTLF